MMKSVIIVSEFPFFFRLDFSVSQGWINILFFLINILINFLPFPGSRDGGEIRSTSTLPQRLG